MLGSLPNETSTNIRNLGDLLFLLSVQEKALIKELEKQLYKVNAAETAVIFNKTCIQEGLLPKWV